MRKVGLSKDTVFIQAIAGVKYGVAHRLLRALTEEERERYVRGFETASDAHPPGVLLCLLCWRPRRGGKDPELFCTCPPLRSVKHQAAFLRNRRVLDPVDRPA